MVRSHCPRRRPKQILRLIKIACLELYEHCIKTLSLLPLATFSHFISLGVGQCKHTIVLKESRRRNLTVYMNLTSMSEE